VIVRATLLIPAYILGEVALSFLGVGVQEPVASWGNMLSASQSLRVLQQFTWSLIPGFFLFLTVLAYNFLGDGLRDAFDPKQLVR
jgi:peptide/nickel transport system permease protein